MVEVKIHDHGAQEFPAHPQNPLEEWAGKLHDDFTTYEAARFMPREDPYKRQKNPNQNISLSLWDSCNSKGSHARYHISPPTAFLNNR